MAKVLGVHDRIAASAEDLLDVETNWLTKIGFHFGH